MGFTSSVHNGLESNGPHSPGYSHWERETSILDAPSREWGIQPCFKLADNVGSEVALWTEKKEITTNFIFILPKKKKRK